MPWKKDAMEKRFIAKTTLSTRFCHLAIRLNFFFLQKLGFFDRETISRAELKRSGKF